MNASEAMAISAPTTSPTRKISALNPMGYAPRIEQLGMAPRTGNLDGKTVYLVDVHFVDGDKLLQQMQAWFAEHLPKVKTVFARKAGVYTEDDPKLFSEIKERDAAVIMAVGHCSTCAPAVAVHCITLENKYGVPTVGIHAKPFASVVKSVAFTRGMPHQRFAFVPMPVMGKSTAELRAYVDGTDPITGKPVMEEVVEALTKPLSEKEKQKTTIDRTTPRLVEPASEDDLQRLFLDNGWTDRLPIIVPTEERVAAMLSGTSRKVDEVVGKMRPTRTREAWQYTVEKVAVNAVMAGAKPEYFPVILALAASGVTARSSTTTSGATMAVVNGPIRHEISMNWGIGAMGPYNHANATIGRAYGLLSQNLQGGSVPGETYMGSQGNNYAYNSVTYAENEERSPWVPLHVQHGFKATDSAISLFRHCRTTSFQMGLREKHWRDHVQYLLRGLNPHTPPTLILDPIVARLFIDRGGFDTKEKLIQWIHDHATIPAGIYWDDQLIQNYIHGRALKGEEPYATHLKAAEDELIPMFRLDEIEVVVVGGETNGYWRIMGCNYEKTVSIDEWR